MLVIVFMQYNINNSIIILLYYKCVTEVDKPNETRL